MNQRLKRGDRLVMTEAALKAKLDGRVLKSRTGVFRGYGRAYTASRTIRVLRDGQKRSENYHESFWRPA